MLVREMTVDECRAVLAGMRIGKLACARDNQPYVVPFHFAYNDNAHIHSPITHLYAFSMPGQKIEWMRANPLVCVEVDEIKRQDDWTSVIIFGRYEELPDTTQFEAERASAHEMFSRHAMWWQPAYAATEHRGESQDSQPIYFRIRIEKMTGHRAVGDLVEGQGGAKRPPTPHHWWDNLWTHGRSKTEKER